MRAELLGMPSSRSGTIVVAWHYRCRNFENLGVEFQAVVPLKKTSALVAEEPSELTTNGENDVENEGVP